MYHSDGFTIVHVHGREILDSRGNPTVEAEVVLDGGSVGRAGSAQSTYLAGTRRLARALFRLLPQSTGLADNLVTVDLPALLRLRNAPPLPRSMVLDDPERDAARKSLGAYSGKADVRPLEAWLEGP